MRCFRCLLSTTRRRHVTPAGVDVRARDYFRTHLLFSRLAARPRARANARERPPTTSTTPPPPPLLRFRSVRNLTIDEAPSLQLFVKQFAPPPGEEGDAVDSNSSVYNCSKSLSLIRRTKLHDSSYSDANKVGIRLPPRLLIRYTSSITFVCMHRLSISLFIDFNSKGRIFIHYLNYICKQ